MSIDHRKYLDNLKLLVKEHNKRYVSAIPIFSFPRELQGIYPPVIVTELPSAIYLGTYKTGNDTH